MRTNDSKLCENLNMLSSSPQYIPTHLLESLYMSSSLSTSLRPSIDVPPTLKMKYLPDHLSCAFLGESSSHYFSFLFSSSRG